MEIDPYENDPARWGASLLNLAEILTACLDAAQARSVVEVGAYAGDLTGLLLDWAKESGAKVSAIDPDPQAGLVRLAKEHLDFKLIRATSHDALKRIPLPDAVIIDGDHNYYTVSEELRLLAERSAKGIVPLLIFHDVSWPHARRDDYFSTEQIPEEHRQPIAEGGGLFPGWPGVRPGGLPYRKPAAEEGGARNGVLTAVEDFVADRDGLRLAIVPAFFGLGVAWHRDAPWAEAVAEVVAPWDRNPVLERLEANRVLHLASSHVHRDERERMKERYQRQEVVLRRLLESRAFSLAERFSKLRHRAGVASEYSVISKDSVRRVLDD